MKNIILLLIAVTVFSCDSLIVDVEPKNLPKIENDFVATCYISPQSTVVYATVKRFTERIGQKVEYNTANYFDQFLITNATVELINIDQKNSIFLKYDSKLRQYLASLENFKITVGQNYQLKITEINGKIHLANTTVPENIVLNLDVSKTVAIGNNNNLFSYTVKWNSPSNSYQRLGSYQIYTFNGVPNENFSGDYNTSYFENNRAETIESIEKIKIYKNTFFDPQNKATLDNYINLLNLDKNYYLYHKSIQKNGESGDNPFAEPSPVKGNISDGYGCFGSYNFSQILIK